MLKAVAEGGLVSDLWASGEVVIHPSIAAEFAEEVRQDRLLIYEQVVESASRLLRESGTNPRFREPIGRR